MNPKIETRKLRAIFIEWEETQVVRKEAARKVVIMADYTKFGRAALINVAPLEVADIVVSDFALDAEYQRLLREHGVEARLA